jgi:CBS domain-containing protein
MRHSPSVDVFSPLTLRAATAADLMSPNPVSVRQDATVREAVAFFADRGFSAAPVVDKAGRPVGVLSRLDILVHDRETVAYAQPSPEYYGREELSTAAGEPLRSGFQVECVDRTSVRDIMTPVVFSVTPETPVREVIEQFRSLKVHRLFVVDHDGALVGVISALDVVRGLR